MISRRFSVLRRPIFRMLHIVTDVAALCVVWWLAAILTRLLGISIPPGVLGMGMLFLLLASGVLPLERIKPGADWLLAEMLLFFVPACVGIVRYFPVLTSYGVRILAAVMIGTVTVMACTALAVDEIYRMERRVRAWAMKQHRSSARRPLAAKRGDAV